MRRAEGGDMAVRGAAWALAVAVLLPGCGGWAAASCGWSSPGARDLDGDGTPETPSTEGQRVDPWSGAGWEGVRILRSVPGTEQVDRRLVRADDVVLLVVLRTDGDDPALLAPADDYLAAVADALD